MLKLVSRFGGDPNEKELDRQQPLVDEIAELEARFKDLTDAQLRHATAEFIGRLHAGESLDDVLAEAFAAVREASKRTTSMRHFDVQILGGIFLHQGRVVEMKTGEGKTLVATLPLYLNALTGRGAHLVTVNEYLARRDVQWMGPIYHLLGLTVGLLQQGEGSAFVFDPDHTSGTFRYLRPVEPKEAYRAHITYGTNHEFGFDYLRDNLAFTLDRRVQRELHYAIVDEVDNILIDEARTPLIISGPSDEPLEEYKRFARIARKLRPEIDYELDEKERNVVLTEAGLAKVEADTGIENIYDESNYQYVHYMEQALRAQALFRKDRDYIKQGQRIVLVDEFTGRLMPDRRLSEGLHQAIEAKEGVPVRPRMMTQATITLQNYFRMYEKLAGMTGTASTEAEELDKIYKLDVIVLPTNVEYMARGPESSLVETRKKEDGTEVVVYCDPDSPDEALFYRRTDFQDAIYKSEKAKWEAIADEIEQLHHAGRPVLVGTTSVEKSEHLSSLLKARGVPHEVLNAKNHTREAAIIARAGEPAAVTIATNMAGRGVDIKLGGELPEETITTAHGLLRSRGMDPYHATPAQLYSAIAGVDPDYVRRRELVLQLGGLHVLGTERHEARRIDNQLRGRSGRQGEPGSSRFFLSLEDDLMRRFGGPSVAGLMDKLGVEEDIPIEHGMVSKTIEGAQTKVEGYNFDIRKHLLEYDDVLNRQRELIYERRYKFLTSNDLESELWEMLESELDGRLQDALSKDGDEIALLTYLNDALPLSLAPPDSPFPYQFPFLGRLTCFPPFSVLFMASQLVTLASDQVPDALLEVSQQGSETYRQHLLDTVVTGPFETTLDQYRDSLARYAESLENRIDDYTSLMEEQDRSFSSQDLVTYIQGVFPIMLGVKAGDLRGLSVPETTEYLLECLERAYHQELCEKLLRAVQSRIPSAMKLEQIRVSDVSPQHVEALLDRSVADSEESVGTGLAQKAQGKGGLLDFLLQMNALVNMDLSAVESILAEATGIAYDRWAEAQLNEMNSAIADRSTQLKSASEQELIPILLSVIYSEKAEFDKGHLKRVSFATRFPLSFLAVPLVRRVRREQLREVILGQLEVALLARQETWGRQEVSRIGQSTLRELDGDLHESLAEHWGESVIQQVEEEPMGQLDKDLLDQVRAYLGVKEIEGVKLASLDIHGRLSAYLEQRLETQAARPDAPLEGQLAVGAEAFLLEEGYFENPEAKVELEKESIANLGSVVRESIAALVGQQQLDELQSSPVAQWDAATRLLVTDYLKLQDRFVDEQKVQRFFVHGSLEELDRQTAELACVFIARRRLEKQENRTIGALKADLRERVLGHLQRRGLLVDEDRRERLAGHTLAELDEITASGLTSHLGERQLEAAGSVSALPQESSDALHAFLRERDYFADQELLESFHGTRVSELENEVYQGLRDSVLADLERDLGQRLIGELPPYVQQIIRRYLLSTDYFLDEEKVKQFDNLTLSALPANSVQVVEQQLGDAAVAEIEQRKFMNLDQGTRESILHYLDREGLFTKKKKREQFTKGSLAELDQAIRDGIAYHLGRERLVELRETRFASLPEELRHQLREHLAGTGFFLDGEKEEYLEIEELKNLDPKLRKGLLSALKRDVEKLLSQHTASELPEELRQHVLQYLEQAEYFLDRDRLALFQAARIEDLEAEARALACQYLGRQVLSGLDDQHVSGLSDGLRQHVETYLEGSDYFLDQEKREKFLQRRLGDLDAEVLEDLVLSLGREVSQESAGLPIAELDKTDREYLREYLDTVGYFVDHDALASFEKGKLGDLRLDSREYDGLASRLGRSWLAENGDRRFGDLDGRLQEGIGHHLRTLDYFVDKGKLQRFRERGLSDLGEETRHRVLRHLSEKRAQEIGEQQLIDLDEETRLEVERFLSEEGFGLDETGMAKLHGRRLVDLDDDTRKGLARYLGYRRLRELAGTRIGELDEASRRELQRFAGKQLMLQIEKQLMLGFTSRMWVDYLTAIEDLRHGIGLQAYGQMDPLVEYKRRAFRMFGELNDNINRMVVGNVFRYPPQPLRLTQGGQS